MSIVSGIHRRISHAVVGKADSSSVVLTPSRDKGAFFEGAKASSPLGQGDASPIFARAGPFLFRGNYDWRVPEAALAESFKINGWNVGVKLYHIFPAKSHSPARATLKTVATIAQHFLQRHTVTASGPEPGCATMHFQFLETILYFSRGWKTYRILLGDLI
eukprot:s429_g3.t1